MKKQDQKNIFLSIKKSARSLWKSFPILISVILLISLATSIIPRSSYVDVFNGNMIVDSFIGSTIGSILAGNPATSYLIAGELMDNGVSLLAVTAFIISWVTVGIVQFPAESKLLGRRFALTRNISSFVLSIVVALVTVVVVGLL